MLLMLVAVIPASLMQSPQEILQMYQVIKSYLLGFYSLQWMPLKWILPENKFLLNTHLVDSIGKEYVRRSLRQCAKRVFTVSCRKYPTSARGWMNWNEKLRKNAYAPCSNESAIFYSYMMMMDNLRPSWACNASTKKASIDRPNHYFRSIPACWRWTRCPNTKVTVLNTKATIYYNSIWCLEPGCFP